MKKHSAYAHVAPRVITALEYMYAEVPRRERLRFRAGPMVERPVEMIRCELSMQLAAMQARWEAFVHGE